jgi:hypothetical protein
VAEERIWARQIRIPLFVLLLFILQLSSIAYAQDDGYYRNTYFDNSLTADFYFYSDASAIAPSVLEQKNGKLPVDTKTFFTPPNALRGPEPSARRGDFE